MISRNSVSNEGNIITVVAITTPTITWDKIPWCLSNNLLIPFDKSNMQARAANTKGIITPKFNLEIPSNIGWYKPKNNSNEDELNPGTIKLNPQTIPQKIQANKLVGNVTFVFNFNKDKMMLRIPMTSARKSGLRRVADASVIDIAENTLKGKAKAKRVQWSKRSQEYVSKINSGDPIAVAEVLRDLYKNPALSEQTYSERQLYEQALSRFSAEYAVVHNITEAEACIKLETILKDRSSSKSSLA